MNTQVTPETACRCGSPNCSDAPYVLPEPLVVHRTGPAPRIPEQRPPTPGAARAAQRAVVLR